MVPATSRRHGCWGGVMKSQFSRIVLPTGRGGQAGGCILLDRQQLRVGTRQLTLDGSDEASHRHRVRNQPRFLWMIDVGAADQRHSRVVAEDRAEPQMCQPSYPG